MFAGCPWSRLTVMTGREIWSGYHVLGRAYSAINCCDGRCDQVTHDGIPVRAPTGLLRAHYVVDMFGTPRAVKAGCIFPSSNRRCGAVLFRWRTSCQKCTPQRHRFGGTLRSISSALCHSDCQRLDQQTGGAHFNYHTMRMELSSFTEVLSNTVRSRRSFCTPLRRAMVGSFLCPVRFSSWYLLSRSPSANRYALQGGGGPLRFGMLQLGCVLADDRAIGLG